MKKVSVVFGCLTVFALSLVVIPAAQSQEVDLPLTWKGEGKAVAVKNDEVIDLAIKLTLKVDTDGWVTGNITTDGDDEAVVKRFYYEPCGEGNYKLIIAFLDNNEEQPSLFIFSGRVLKGQLFFGEVLRKDYNKDGEIEQNLSLGDNTAQEIYSDYFPSSLKKAMEKCEPIGCLAAKGGYVQ